MLPLIENSQYNPISLVFLLILSVFLSYLIIEDAAYWLAKQITNYYVKRCNLLDLCLDVVFCLICLIITIFMLWLPFLIIASIILLG
jgi:hypothetical protein